MCTLNVFAGASVHRHTTENSSYIFFLLDGKTKEPKQHLGAFLSKNTSVDNSSLVEI